MSEPPFHRTQMGQRFFEQQLPQLIAHLGRIADNLQWLVRAMTPFPQTPQETKPEGSKPGETKP